MTFLELVQKVYNLERRIRGLSSKVNDIEDGGGGNSPITTVFGRTGDIVATNNDYTFAQIGSKPTTLAGYGITDGITIGAASSTDNAIVRFDSTTGKIIQNSAVIVDDDGNIVLPTTMYIGSGTRTLTFLQASDNTGGFKFAAGSGNANAAGIVQTGTFNANSGTNFHHVVSMTQNGGGTSGYIGSRVSVYEQSAGSGSKLLLDLGTRSAAYPSGTHTSKFSVDSSGIIIMPTTGQIISYNTTDQTTNYERTIQYWNSNVYTLATEAGGTGTLRNVVIASGSTVLNVRNSPSITGCVNFNRALSTGGTTLFGLSTTATNSSGNVNINYALPTINQSGSAGYRASGVTVYEQSIGSGPRYLCALSTNTAANGTGTLTERFTVTATGLTTAGQYALSALNTAPSSASDTGVLGEIRIDANFIYICTATNTWKRVAIATW